MIIYTLTDMIMAAIFAGLGAGLIAGLIVDTYHRRQAQQPAQPPPAAARPAADPAQAADPYSPEAKAQLRQALDALQQMQRSAHAYKELAEGLEQSLAKARRDAAEAQQEAQIHNAWAAQQEERAEHFKQQYEQRTQQALAAGFTLVIDHGDRGRRHHPHREDPRE